MWLTDFQKISKSPFSSVKENKRKDNIIVVYKVTDLISSSYASFIWFPKNALTLQENRANWNWHFYTVDETELRSTSIKSKKRDDYSQIFNKQL